MRYLSLFNSYPALDPNLAIVRFFYIERIGKNRASSYAVIVTSELQIFLVLGTYFHSFIRSSKLKGITISSQDSSIK